MEGYKGYGFEPKMAHLGKVLTDALAGVVGDDVILEKLAANGVLDSASNTRYRESQAQSRFDALEDKRALITLASEVHQLADKVQDIEADINLTRSNFRVDVSAVDYDPARADVTNVARWAETLKLALDAAKAAAESSLNSPNGDGATKLSVLAGYKSSYTGKHNQLREALDKAGFQTHNLTPDGKLVLRPATVKPKASGRKPGGKHGVVVIAADGSKREFASRIECARALKAEGIAPFDKLSEREENTWMSEETWQKKLSAAGLHFAA